MTGTLASFAVLVAVVAAIPVVLWLVNRLGRLPSGRRGPLSLTASLSLGPRERIAVVKVADRWLVLGITAGAISLLRELDEEPVSTEPAAGGFADVLRRAQRPSGTLRSAATALAWPAAALAIGLPMLLGAGDAQAQGLLSLQSTQAGGSTTWSVPIQTLLVFTALSFLPAVLLLMTSFTRIIIVLSLVRQAIGLQSAPPNQVMIGMALFMTAFVMAPTLERVYHDAYKPFADQSIAFEQALERGAIPLREFMLAQTRSGDLALFARVAKLPTEGEAAVKPADVPFRVLVPAFVISELKTAFQIGFMVFIPFILIDLICASVLMSLGMMMVSPVLVALPFKLVLFVLADGWNLLVGSLVASFMV